MSRAVTCKACFLKGSMPPCIDHMELLAWMQRADFSEHIQRFKLHGNPLNSPHFDAPNTKFAPTGYRRAPTSFHITITSKTPCLAMNERPRKR